MNRINAPGLPSQEQREFQALQCAVYREKAGETRHPFERQMLDAATREAAAIAWSRPFPLLALPALMEEKLTEASRYAKRQLQLWKETENLYSTAE